MIFFILQRLSVIAHFPASDLPLLECILNFLSCVFTFLQAYNLRLAGLTSRSLIRKDYLLYIALYILNMFGLMSWNEKVDYTSHKQIKKNIYQTKRKSTTYNSISSMISIKQPSILCISINRKCIS